MPGETSGQTLGTRRRAAGRASTARSVAPRLGATEVRNGTAARPIWNVPAVFTPLLLLPRKGLSKPHAAGRLGNTGRDKGGRIRKIQKRQRFQAINESLLE
jgi:hypothetical protein